VGADDTTAPSATTRQGPRWLQSEPAVSREELGQAFPLNLLYFWVGRYAGAALYFFPAVLGVILFLGSRGRSAAGWLALATLLLSSVFYVRVIPDNWFGGSGTIGNRYFLNLLPLALVLIPERREWFLAIGSLVGLVFVGPILADPVSAALRGGHHTLLTQFRLAPLELTMLNDLTLFGEPGRKKQAFGDVGDDTGRRPPAPDSYFLYFPDDSTYGREAAFGGSGFWLRGDSEGEVILRANAALGRMRLRLRGGPEADRVQVRVGSERASLALRKNEVRTIEINPGGAVLYHGTWLYVLHFRSAHGAVVHDPGERRLGTFVMIDVLPS
jgi:hypothetical protein